MIPLEEAFGLVAPYYNLVLVVIVIFMFIKILAFKNKKIFLMPWRLLFVAITVYIVEEILTVLHEANFIYRPRIFNALFELIIISIAVYMLLVQKQYLLGSRKNQTKNQNIKKTKRKKKK